ncbi:MAG: hypothetical protein AABY08_01750 [Candidatus Thermoplasmatota archaeon]
MRWAAGGAPHDCDDRRGGPCHAKVGEDFVLTVLLWSDANLGLTLLHIGRVTEQIAFVLSK